MGISNDILVLGDEVSLAAPYDNAVGVVYGFDGPTLVYVPRFRGNDDRTPGVYSHRGSPKILLRGSGIDASGVKIIGLVNKELEKIRMAEGNHAPGRDRLLCDLPQTKLWELDTASLTNDDGTTTEVLIQTVHYAGLYRSREDGSPMPLYTVVSENNGTITAHEDELTLVKRGNVWRHYHYEPLQFKNLTSILEFYAGIGRGLKRVANPATGEYLWSRREIIKAMREGIVDCFAVMPDFAIPDEGERSHQAVQFPYEYRDIGQRIRQTIVSTFDTADML